jgi:transposase
VADVIDAVVGVDTHRDTHDAEIATPTGIPIATMQVPNTSEGFAALLAWVAARSPGPRTLFAVEGTRSYGIGLARAVAATGQLVVEIERPTRAGRRRRGKSDPIDAHLAVLTAVRLDAGRLPLPRADGDREALRILLGARADLVATATAQTNRLRALLLGGNDADRQTARGVLTDARLAALARMHRSDFGLSVVDLVFVEGGVGVDELPVCPALRWRWSWPSGRVVRQRLQLVG